MKRDGRPVVITQNGEAAAVLVPPEEYDRLAYRAEFIAAVERGFADSDAGRLVDSADLATEARARIDLIDIGDYIAVRNPLAAAGYR